MTTKRENLLRMLRGEKPAWTPCSINFMQWFSHHRNFGSLPDELRGASSYLHAMKILGCDIFSRNCDGGYRSSYDNVEVITTQEPGEQGPRSTTTLVTPHGNLRHIYEAQPAMTTGYDVEDFVKDWDQDKKAYLWTLERWRATWDEQAYLKTDEEIGNDGIVLVPCAQSPLKRLHIDFGLDGACFLLADAPEDADRIARLHWERVMPMLRRIAASDRVYAVCLMDNIDTSFYPPQVAQRYWTPYVREAADLLHASGKKLFVHACGKLHLLKNVFREAGVDGLEGMAHPPLGDWTMDDTLSMPDGFIYNGGFTAHEQVTKSDDEVRQYYDEFFHRIRPWNSFIFAAACQTAITTPWQRIKQVTQICREHGGQPRC